MGDRLWQWFLAAAWLVGVGWAAEPDPFMGDWAGSRRTAAGEQPVAAQVLALGKGTYRLNLLTGFDQAGPPAAVLEGQATAGEVRFGEALRLSGVVLQGEGPAAFPGSLRLTPVSRPSPTLGAPPPAGAVVLFDGTHLDAWRQGEKPYGIVDLKQVLGAAEQAAGYLRNAIQSPEARRVRLELGSDDGAKVWLNGTVVHEVNAPRGLVAGQDKVEVELKPGWNDLLVKVAQGGGDWGAHGRVVGLAGEPVEGLAVRLAPRAAEGILLSGLGQRVNGTILSWEVAGPFRQDGVTGAAVLTTAFAPETAPAEVAWKRTGELEPARGTRWKLLGDGAMEIAPKAGSLVTKEAFGDLRLHLEFRTPFMPDARGQARGNSGVYLQGRYEVQILDSYGLEGLDNECGGLYKVARPRVNMCAPPLQWQTYDIEFSAPRFDAQGTRLEPARVTVRHNGVLIHDRVALAGATGGGSTANHDKPGPLQLQDHGNPVQFRNIWVVPGPAPAVP